MALFQDNQEKLQTDLRELKRENLRLSEALRGIQDDAQRKSEQFADRVDRLQGIFIRIRELAGCLDAKTALEFAWDILSNAFQIERGGIFKAEGKRLWPIIGVNLSAENPDIPLDEESMVTYAMEHNLTLTLKNLRENQELSGLERRGAYPDARIVSPFTVSGVLGGAIIICKFGGNIFSESGEIDLIRVVASILGLSLTNARIIEEQRKTLDSRTQELAKVRGIFSRMVSPEVIRSIEANPAGISLGGCRQAVVTMFVDIRGFTAMSEALAPERLVEMLNQYFGCITEIIIAHRGTLDKFIGDAVMALFSTPVPLQDAVVWAFAAAVAIQRSVQELVAQLHAEGFPSFGIGIGLNYQEVVAGMIGSQRLSSFTAIGDGVNTASRFCSVARAGEIAVGQSVFDQLKDWEGLFETREGITLKGKSHPVTIYIHTPSPETPGVPLPVEKAVAATATPAAAHGSPGAVSDGQGAGAASTVAGDNSVNRTSDVAWTDNPDEIPQLARSDVGNESSISFHGDRPISITEERRRKELAVPYLDGWGGAGELSSLLPIGGVPPSLPGREPADPVEVPVAVIPLERGESPPTASEEAKPQAPESSVPEASPPPTNPALPPAEEQESPVSTPVEEEEKPAPDSGEEVKVCGKCGTRLKPGVRFCGSCGHRN